MMRLFSFLLILPGLAYSGELRPGVNQSLSISTVSASQCFRSDSAGSDFTAGDGCGEPTTLNVKGSSQFGSGATKSTITANGELYVGGISTFTGAIQANNGGNIDGALTVDTATVNGTITVGNNVIVTVGDNVGINVASPDQALHVVDTGGTGNGQMKLGDGGAAVAVIYSDGQIIMDLDDNSDGATDFRIRDGADATKFIVEEIGDVGINTTSPDATLDITAMAGQGFVLQISSANETDLITVAHDGNATFLSSVTLLNHAFSVGGSTLSCSGGNCSFGGNTTIGAGGTPLSIISTGVYVSTLTSTANLDGTTNFQCSWIRVGNQVTYYGAFNANPTTTNTATTMGMSLPVSSNLALDTDLGGSGANAVNEPLRIIADTSNDRALIDWQPVGVNNQTYSFTFTYVVK